MTRLEKLFKTSLRRFPQPKNSLSQYSFLPLTLHLTCAASISLLGGRGPDPRHQSLLKLTVSDPLVTAYIS